MDRVCTKCQQRKPADEFYGAARSWCKECHRAYERARRKPRTPPREVLPEGQRRCAACKQVLALDQFRLRRTGKPYSYCHACQRAANEATRRRRVARDVDKQSDRASTRGPRGPLGTKWARWRAGGGEPYPVGSRGPIGSEWAPWRQSGERRCPRCGETKPVGAFSWDAKKGHPRGWCRACFARHHARWRKTPAGKAAEQRYNRKASRTRQATVRRFTLLAIELGLLVRQPCEVCGATKRIHAHHVDYADPLRVRWLCSRHHADVHNGERP